MCTEKIFLNNVADHQIEVIRDDGVHRHIRFKKPDTSNMYFDLITWPGALCYTGDMGTYVFRRLTDMFEFFRTDQKTPYLASKGLTLGINLSYWAEKLEAVDRHGDHQEFSPEKFKRVVCEHRKEWLRECPKADRRGLWNAIRDDVLICADDGESLARHAANGFRHETPTQKFYFTDFWEYNLDAYTYHFQWCCYAIAWGVKKYDELKSNQPITIISNA